MRAKMLLYRDSTNFTPVWCTVFDGLESLARSVRNTIFFRRRHFAARKAKSGQREVKIHEQHENSELKRRAPKSKVTLTGVHVAKPCKIYTGKKKKKKKKKKKTCLLLLTRSITGLIAYLALHLSSTFSSCSHTHTSLSFVPFSITSLYILTSSSLSLSLSLSLFLSLSVSLFL